MPNLHPKTALNSPFRILCSENEKFALKNCNCALNRSPRILRSKNGNSDLKKWKFHAQKWKFCTQKMENFPNAMQWKVRFSVIFLCQIRQFYAAALKLKCRAKFSNPGIAESWRDWLGMLEAGGQFLTFQLFWSKDVKICWFPSCSLRNCGNTETDPVPLTRKAQCCWPEHASSKHILIFASKCAFPNYRRKEHQPC